jgi:hypothetical protein
MKILLLAASLSCLAACRTPLNKKPEWAREPQPVDDARATDAADAPSEIDLAASAGREMTVEQFVKTCQVASGFNFTWGPDTDTALKASSVRLSEQQHVTSTEFPGYLETTLASAGFTCKRVGPEHLRVYLVERRAT